MWRILCLPIDNIYRQILTFFLNKCMYENYTSERSPTYSMYVYAKMYGLVDLIKSDIVSNNKGKVKYYKDIVKRTVREHEAVAWRITNMYFYLQPVYVDCVKRISISPWWKFVQHNPRYFKPVSALLAVLCGSQPKYYMCNFNDNKCMLCYDLNNDSPQHIIFECDRLKLCREYHVKRIKFVMPHAMKCEFECMNNYDKMCFLLSAMNCDFNLEWNILYEFISLFVFDIFKTRKAFYDIINTL
mgnify:CR=1 FL=1